MLVRDFGNNGQFSMNDWTQEINVVPNQWGTIGQMGIFTTESVSTHVVQFEEIVKDGALIVDRIRGERSTVGRDASRKVHAFNVPHFPLADAIYPSDIQGIRAYGSPSEVETIDLVRARKMERIRQNHAWTLEYARAYALVTGKAYAPNGTIDQDWYVEFTGSTVPAATSFAFSDATTPILEKIEGMIAAIQDNASGTNFTGVVALCGTNFFSKLINHATVKQAYMYYSSTQEINRTAGRTSATAMHREFFYGSVRFVEMRDSYNGQRLIPVDQAVFVPTGTDSFKTYFSPANRFFTVNTLGEEVYMFEQMNPAGTQWDIETESNFINALLRPMMVQRATV